MVTMVVEVMVTVGVVVLVVVVSATVHGPGGRVWFAAASSLAP